MILKLKPNLILAVCCLLALAGCGNVPSSSPLEPTYAELRVTKGEMQLLLETGHGSEFITPGGNRRQAYHVLCAFLLRGMEPTFAINQDEDHATITGTIMIDKMHSRVILDLLVSTNVGTQKSPYKYNGTYPLDVVTFSEPFYP